MLHLGVILGITLGVTFHWVDSVRLIVSEFRYYLVQPVFYTETNRNVNELAIFFLESMEK